MYLTMSFCRILRAKFRDRNPCPRLIQYFLTMTKLLGFPPRTLSLSSHFQFKLWIINQEHTLLTTLGLDMIWVSSVLKVDLGQFSSVQIHLIKIQTKLKPKDLTHFLIQAKLKPRVFGLIQLKFDSNSWLKSVVQICNSIRFESSQI